MSAHATQQTAAPRRADPQRAATHQPLAATHSRITPIKRLQRTVGNRALASLLGSPMIQRKLEVSEPDDEFEREADRVADEVMRMPEPESSVQEPVSSQSQETTHYQPSITLARTPVRVSRKCGACEMEEHKEREPEVESQAKPKEVEEERESEEDKLVQTKFAAPDPPEVPNNVESDLNNSSDGGSPLTKRLRNFFEPRFGADLSGVRLHADARSAELAEQLNASAFTVGRDVFFGAGQYAPTTNQGRHLIAHELAHTLQQSAVEPAKATAVPPNQSLLESEKESDEDEQELDEETGKNFIRTGLVLPPSALSLVMPLLRMPLLRMPLAPIIQRRANVRLAPPGLSCIAMDVTGTPGELDLMFDHNTSLPLNATHQTLIENYVGLWVGLGMSRDLIISGYASTDGSQRHNWQLSCDRAEAVKAELVRIGVPDTKTTTFAHGETSDFDTTNLEPNRRVTIDSVAGTGPTITPTLTPNDNFAGRSLTRFGLSELIFVDYTATPSIAAAEHFGVQWITVSGTGTIVNLPGRDNYTAGNTPATERLALIVSTGPAVGTQLVTVDIPVIAPITAYMQQAPGSGLCHTTGVGSVGFLGNIFFLPPDVSFNALQWREDDAIGVGLGSLSAFNGLHHGVKPFFPIGNGNVATGCQVNAVDQVTSGHATPSTFLGFFADWTGTFLWPIPWQYQAPGGPVVSLMLSNHLVTIDSAGTATISKAGSSPVSSPLAAATSTATFGGVTLAC